MKTPNFLTACLAAAVLSPVVGAFTYQSPDELFLTADVDGDGRDDAVIVDRSTGGYRIGYQLSSGVYTWSEARPSGIQSVASVTKGRILTLGCDALAFTGDTDNVVNVLDAADPATEGQLVPVYPAGIDSHVVVSLNIQLLPSTTQDDLIIATDESAGGAAGQELINSKGGGLFQSIGQNSWGRWLAADRVQLGLGLPDVLGILVDTGITNNFRVIQLGPPSVNQLIVDNQPVPSQFTFGNFGPGTLNQFLFNTPGQSNLVIRSVTQPSPGVFKLTSSSVYSLGFAFDQLQVIAGSPSRLLAIATAGTEARVYNYDGVNPPVLLQSITPSGSDHWSGVLPTGGGNFQMLSASANAHRSATSQPFKFNGSKFTPGAATSLPGVDALALGANVFLFQSEPFVNSAPGLVRSLNAADWSSAPNLSGGQLVVTAEADRGVPQGLGHPVVKNLGTLPASAHFGLVNQYHPSISLVSFDAISPNPTSAVTISPVAGPQTQSVPVTLTVGNPGYQALYSLNGGPWTVYSSPFWVFKTTHVRYLASQIGGSAKSQTFSASYTFATPPGLADSDHDGVPDYVELAYGLNPTTGPDTDGDGFSDLNEILVGTDPGATNSIPATNQITESFQSFDFHVALRPLEPTLVIETNPVVGVTVGVHDLDGSLLRSGLTTNVIGATFNPTAPITNILAERQPAIIAFGTDPTFSIQTSASDANVGHELIGLLRTPIISRPVVNYTYGGGSLATEAANWVAAAKLAYQSAPHPTVETRIGIPEVLAALLTERKVNQVLSDRLVPGFTATNLTLFPFRVGDVGRQAATLDQLNSLSLELDALHPAYDLGNLHVAILSNLVAVASPLQPLLQLGSDVYRISGLSNNIAPGNYAQPIDVLRAFLITGQLASNYAAVTTLSPSTITSATTAVANLLNSLAGRPVAEFDLTVQPDSFQPNVTRLLQTSTGHQKNLFIKTGVPYLFPQSFMLVEGSIVHVVAYTDFVDPDTTGESLQVIDAVLISAPPVPVSSAGNGLTSDAWGLLFFGGSFDPFADADGDGISNLQEFLDGTDPTDSKSHHAKAAALGVPKLSVGAVDVTTGGLTLSFAFPSAYASAFNFYVQKTPVLGGNYETLPLAPVASGPDQLSVNLPAVQDGVGFFRVVMLLK